MNDIDTIEAKLKDLLDGPYTELSISFNSHASGYQTAEEAVNDGEYGCYNHCDWVSEVDKKVAVVNNSVWVLQVYPSTPIGFYAIAGSSMRVVLEKAGIK